MNNIILNDKIFINTLTHYKKSFDKNILKDYKNYKIKLDLYNDLINRIQIINGIKIYSTSQFVMDINGSNIYRIRNTKNDYYDIAYAYLTSLLLNKIKPPSLLNRLFNYKKQYNDEILPLLNNNDNIEYDIMLMS